MNSKNLVYLAVSRYITYIAVFITSLLTIGSNSMESVYFSLLFLLIFINSSVRVNKFSERTVFFISSILIEIPIILFMNYRFNSISFIFLYIIIVDSCLYLKFKYAVYMSIVICLAILVLPLITGDITDLKNLFINFIANVVMAIFFVAASSIVRREFKLSSEIQALNEELKDSRDELQAANDRLTEYAIKIEDNTVLNERNRLAGEIHDTIGHSLTALIMEIDICGKLLDKDIEKTREELMKASELARNTLSEVRRSVRAIMPSSREGHTGIRAIEELISDFQKTTRIQVDFNLSKQQYSLTTTTEIVIYRTIQEALTNCAKHGQADKAIIDLDFKDGKVLLTIRDNGKGCEEFMQGIGLRTMDERIRSLGGSISLSGSKGFLINVMIPVEVA